MNRTTDHVHCLLGGTCLDAAGALAAATAMSDITGHTPQVWRCPNAAAHPHRPLHLGRRPASRSQRAA